MKFSRIACIAALAVCFLPQMGAAGGVNDVAHDKHGGQIYDKRGGCVRTKWTAAGEECGQIQKSGVVAVYFDFNKSKLDRKAKATLNALVKDVKASGKHVKTTIIGYADHLGKDGYNSRLSQKRAAAVKKYLSHKGLPTDATEIQGLGETASQSACADKNRDALIKCLWRDRRVEVKVEYLN